eukprot:3849332-Amphidinium_carterae.1
MGSEPDMEGAAAEDSSRERGGCRQVADFWLCIQLLSSWCSGTQRCCTRGDHEQCFPQVSVDSPIQTGPCAAGES